jgi:hypothetical protein
MRPQWYEVSKNFVQPISRNSQEIYRLLREPSRAPLRNHAKADVCLAMRTAMHAKG